jgi:phosphoribosylamine--glycine ligase/phosphoribosylaminoimidazole synthetase
MRVLIVGSGAREHAIARAVSRSPLLSRLWIAPGNAGTALLGENAPVSATDIAAIADLARRERIDLVVPGPEAPLAAGLADAMRGLGLPCFGPTAAAARIESSKAFAKAFMDRHGIPTARWAFFEDPAEAKAHIASAPYPVVVKASALASGKGVVVPADAGEALAAVDRVLAAAGGSGGIVVEEKLEGEEVSLIALCDGSRLAVMPPARDHKRLLEGDLGPNTGGMGAIAPSPSCPPALAAEIERTVLGPALGGLAADGSPFVGALYAGIMLTASGPRVLEFNCRLGDPEAEALLPLAETDLLELLAACASGDMRGIPPRWATRSAAAVVIAAPGYPDSTLSGIRLPPRVFEGDTEEAYLLHGGTRLAAASSLGRAGGEVLSTGGRVLCAVGLGASLDEALGRAYERADRARFEGSQLRRDIGSSGVARDIGRMSRAGRGSAYAAAGVDIDAGNAAVELMKEAVLSTYGPEVVAGIGSFGGLYDATALKAMDRPLLVSSTDGVGTKVKIAGALGRWRGVGVDIVNHCIDDILVQGARPLFFLDYVASSRLDPRAVAEAVAGMAEACRAAGCALIGGETAEMPGTYRDGESDIAGTIVGVVEAGRALPRDDLAEGDLLVGLASRGAHTNGYSLLRSIFAGEDLGAEVPELGESLADALLRPHRSYLRVLLPALEGEPGLVKALAHITGGGFAENMPRVLPRGLDAVARRGSWPVPPLFELARKKGNVSEDEMSRVFNMGIGMVAVLSPDRLARFRDLAGEACWVIGKLVRGSGKARIE